MSVIHVEDLTASYGYQPVLWDIDVDIEEGSLTAIVGPNGAGKSTLLKSISFNSNLFFISSLHSLQTCHTSLFGNL